MSIVIVLIAVLVVGGLIAKFYPNPKQTTFLAPGEILTPDETSEELAPETAVIIEPLVVSKIINKAPKMDAKPKKKQNHKKPAKKVNA
jgi:hypothetical protein